MEGERKRSKRGLLNLFDWNGKSRKKLFLNNPELPATEEPKQGQESVESLATSQLHAIEVDDRKANSSSKGSSDFSCASSVISDEGHGTRAPGVVARLMGLDSLPTSNSAEPSSTPFVNPSSFRASQYDKSSSNLLNERSAMDYPNVSSNQEGRPWNSLESRSQKVQNHPIQRFQTEMLPPKSAKSISVTHHKLLSPIRSPGFAPRKNAAYIMEAAAKIIEESPKANMNGKTPSIGSPSVPLRIRDLKQKMEAAHTASRPQRTNGLSSAKNSKGPHCDKSPSRLGGLSSCKATTVCAKGTSDGAKNKGKSVSHTVPVKSNIQRREGAISKDSNIKKQKEVTSNKSPKSPPSTQKTKRTFDKRTNNVLRQNSQKQNSSLGKESSTLKNSISNQAGRKAQTINGSVSQSRTINRVIVNPETSRKTRLVVTDSEKEKSSASLKKKTVNGELQTGKSVSDGASPIRDGRSIKCNISIDGAMKAAVDNRKNGMDVVSFTFTSPVKKSSPNSQPSVTGTSNNSVIDLLGSNDHPHFSKSTSSFPGMNIIGGDALGILLEQKLRELVNKVESSQSNTIRDETSVSSASSLQNCTSMCNAVPAGQDRKSMVEKDSLDHIDDFDCFSVDNSRVDENQKWQGSKEMEECCSSNFSEAEKDQHLDCSPVSILEPGFENGSFSNTNAESDEALTCFSTNETLEGEGEGETELSDSASSKSTVKVGRKSIVRTFSIQECKESSEWELDYVRDVIINAEPMLKDFKLDRSPKVINPRLFHQLENQETLMKIIEEECSKIERKVLFDCVSECLELMCGQTFDGSYKSWAKTWTMLQRKGWLAEASYKEILGWKSMGDLMVDELVDKDMRTAYGKWLNFNIETFEEGVEIEKEILTCLIDELVSDLFVL